jgi:hypothetical protein
VHPGRQIDVLRAATAHDCQKNIFQHDFGSSEHPAVVSVAADIKNFGTGRFDLVEVEFDVVAVGAGLFRLGFVVVAQLA